MKVKKLKKKVMLERWKFKFSSSPRGLVLGMGSSVRSLLWWLLCLLEGELGYHAGAGAGEVWR